MEFLLFECGWAGSNLMRLTTVICDGEESIGPALI